MTLKLKKMEMRQSGVIARMAIWKNEEPDVQQVATVAAARLTRERPSAHGRTRRRRRTRSPEKVMESGPPRGVPPLRRAQPDSLQDTDEA
ncbi:hypothetical protein [Ralstonia solanacearum]|uniref:hypothetical protein n=1 Tax=Ralstonia solanacearum TaxID=305 RepID=UPI000AAD6505|nr:hypothetical protein [Ralstonia solanacearum]